MFFNCWHSSEADRYRSTVCRKKLQFLFFTIAEIVVENKDLPNATNIAL